MNTPWLCAFGTGAHSPLIPASRTVGTKTSSPTGLPGEELAELDGAITKIALENEVVEELVDERDERVGLLSGGSQNNLVLKWSGYGSFRS